MQSFRAPVFCLQQPSHARSCMSLILSVPTYPCLILHLGSQQPNLFFFVYTPPLVLLFCPPFPQLLFKKKSHPGSICPVFSPTGPLPFLFWIRRTFTPPLMFLLSPSLQQIVALAPLCCCCSSSCLLHQSSICFCLPTQRLPFPNLTPSACHPSPTGPTQYSPFLYAAYLPPLLCIQMLKRQQFLSPHKCASTTEFLQQIVCCCI